MKTQTDKPKQNQNPYLKSQTKHSSLPSRNPKATVDNEVPLAATSVVIGDDFESAAEEIDTWSDEELLKCFEQEACRIKRRGADLVDLFQFFFFFLICF